MRFVHRFRIMLQGQQLRSRKRILSRARRMPIGTSIYEDLGVGLIQRWSYGIPDLEVVEREVCSMHIKSVSMHPTRLENVRRLKVSEWFRGCHRRRTRRSVVDSGAGSRPTGASSPGLTQGRTRACAVTSRTTWLVETVCETERTPESRVSALGTSTNRW